MRHLRPRSVVQWLAAGLGFVLFAAAFSLAAVKLAPLPSSPSTARSIPPTDTCPPPRVSRSPAANAGAYYFDGWSGPLDDVHFRGLVDGRFGGREPLVGWRDATAQSMSRQLGWAHHYGISFFVFDWYDTSHSTSPRLNHALQVYRGLPNSHHVGYALMYVNTNTGEDFVVKPFEWPSVVRGWIHRDFLRKRYERVDGKPLLVILDIQRFTRQFGGVAGANAALATLRREAVAAGLPGVFVLGGVYVDERFDWDWYRYISSAENFDAFTQYAAPAAAGVQRGERPYAPVVAAMQADWGRFAASGAKFVPAVMTGWDPRPWGTKVGGRLWWFRRSPGELRSFVANAVRYASTNRIEPAPAKPLVLLEAWNELGEGAFIVPTVGACHRYGEAIASGLSQRR